ncbi:hypothetical protein AUP74_02170 [Microbulbifer aggregans]|uniref:Threonine/serine exporter-like N-terminal domain-containing protein n=1 Tax=Microbulbifer aggregans TaxID=1769779 RepID=A0A1C9W8V6_9GAMM|nr:threonine/serine exporter family protein [Microbulbifer aggregans]AOS97586.1 hypothetical protein AUP74_02170 [Microbulbifer aggregans]
MDGNERIADEAQLQALLRELSQQLLTWSWEGVAGYEQMVERVGRCYGYPDTTVNMDAQSAMIKLDPDAPITFVKCGIPGFPPLAKTQDIRNLLEDIYAGKLSVHQARESLKGIQKKEPPYSPFLVWLGVILISVAFAVDIVGTWEGLLWAGITAMATGLVFLAADRIPTFSKIGQLTATLVSGIIVMLAFKFGWTTAAPGLLLIASTFVFLPGDSISTQAFELAEGKWSAGIARLGYSIMTLVLMVTGAFLAAMFTGTTIKELLPTGPHDAFPWWAAYPGHALMLLGILLAFQMRWRHFPQGLLTMLATTAVLQLATMAYGETAGIFLAMTAGTILALWLSRKPYQIPAFVMVIPLVFMLSPGSRGLRQFETWLSGESITGVNDFQTAAATLLAIAMGMLVGSIIGRRWIWFRERKRI